MIMSLTLLKEDQARPEGNDLWLSAQLQYFGGKHSELVTNANNCQWHLLQLARLDHHVHPRLLPLAQEQTRMSKRSMIRKGLAGRGFNRLNFYCDFCSDRGPS